MHAEWMRLVAAWGYPAAFVLATVEGPVVSVLAGLLAARGALDLAAVFAVLVSADLCGDLAYYAAGRFGARSALLRPLARKTLGEARLEALRERLRQRPGRMLVFGKLTHSAGFAILSAAGAARVPLPTFLAYNLAATVPKSALLLAAGYGYGEILLSMGTTARIASLAASVAVIAAVAVWTYRLTRGDRTRSRHA